MQAHHAPPSHAVPATSAAATTAIAGTLFLSAAAAGLTERELAESMFVLQLLAHSHEVLTRACAPTASASE